MIPEVKTGMNASTGFFLGNFGTKYVIVLKL
jgi:hypothetical protein